MTDENGWQCSTCQAVAFGAVTAYCGRCGEATEDTKPERVTLTICDIRACMRHHELTGGHRVHVRLLA